MIDHSRKNQGQGLGIAGFVLGIVSIPLAIMGCTFIIALLIGAVGIVLSAIGLSQAKQTNSPRSMTIAGLVVSIIGTSIAIFWFMFIGSAFNNAMKHQSWFDGLEQLENLPEQIERDIEEDADFEDDSKNMDKLEKRMEELEGEIKEIENEKEKIKPEQEEEPDEKEQ
ncbi:MAG: DUF4190 domain-containing protein [Bacteroidales bacterium]